MARRVARGEVWTCQFGSPDKERPVAILSREVAIDVLDTVMVAPITSTVRGIPSEVPLGRDAGLDHPSAANLDHVQTVAKSRLKRRLGRLQGAQMNQLCEALRIAVGCDG